MTVVQSVDARAWSRSGGHGQRLVSPNLCRVLFGTIFFGAVGLSVFVADVGHTSRAAVTAGDDLTRLLRFMALIKAGLALGAIGAVAWRLGSAASLVRLVTYCGVCTLMVTGPGLIWGMEHVGLGALLLHGGLVAVIALLWRDPAVTMRLEAALIRRRS